jgi:hypothetical protein
MISPKLLGYLPGVWITPPRASNGAWQLLVRLQVHFASGPNGVDLVGFDLGLVRFHVYYCLMGISWGLGWS